MQVFTRCVNYCKWSRHCGSFMDSWCQAVWCHSTKKEKAGTKKPFFCSNASIALARSLCKSLLAVLMAGTKKPKQQNRNNKKHNRKPAKQTKNKPTNKNHQNKKQWNESIMRLMVKSVMTRQLVCLVPSRLACNSTGSKKSLSVSLKPVHSRRASSGNRSG